MKLDLEILLEFENNSQISKNILPKYITKLCALSIQWMIFTFFNEIVFLHILRANVFARFSSFSSNVTVTCTRHHYRTRRTICRRDASPRFSFRFVYTPHGANIGSSIDRYSRSIVTHACRETESTATKEWVRPTKQPTNRTTDWLTDWWTDGEVYRVDIEWKRMR